VKVFCTKNLSHVLACLGTFSLIFCGAAAWAAEATCSAQSAAHRVDLVELYTSEGCSSCPPADAWLRTFPSPHSGVDESVVPLALHVDYWNSSAWTDRFSDARYTARQNQHAADAHSRLVYTPEVFVNGRELRDWSRSNLPAAAVAGASHQAAPADVELSQRIDGAGHYVFKATLTRVTGDHGPVAVSIALTQNNLVSQVQGGENSGATLRHAFAARALSSPLVAADGTALAELTGVLPKDAAPGDLGVIAFAEDQRSGEVLQTLAAPLCRAGP
jgi:hypothetical protein